MDSIAGIAATSTAMSLSRVQAQAGVMMLGKVMEAPTSSIDILLQSLSQTIVPMQPVASHLGQVVDVST